MLEERTTLFVDVILPIPVNTEFTYRVPFELNEYIQGGIRVVVPFGKSKLITGVVTKVHKDVPSYPAKYVEYVLDESPIITANQLKLWKWMSTYYLAPIGDILNAALPANYKLASETKIVIHPEYERNSVELTDREQETVDAVSAREEIDVKDLAEVLGIKTVMPIVNKLIQKRVLITLEDIQQKYTPKMETFIGINPILSEADLNDVLNTLESKKGKEKQLEALLRIIQKAAELQTPMVPKNVFSAEDISLSSLNTLIKNGFVVSERLEVSRIKRRQNNELKSVELSGEQNRALEEIHQGFEADLPVLLHGVTGAGKTEIYVKLIEEQLAKGKQVLFLLPEIALTTQLIQRLSKFFGEQIGVYHSKFNQNERVEIWRAVLQNNPNRFRIVIGARSSLFLPFQDLGLIVIDEEHDASFKQYDPSPRYNARDSAIVLSKFHKANVVLGSATPAIETYYNAQTGKYRLVELLTRYSGVQMPEILCADMRKARQQKAVNGDFSFYLIDHIREALKNKEQVILFQNRRGFTPVWMCEVCHWTPRCKQCDVALTYHKFSNLLKCHYCSYTQPPMGSCQSCGSHRIKMIGFGTQKVEDDFEQIFPEAIIKRMDIDSTRSKHAYESIIHDFEDRKIDILVGTQMLTKGLDFDNVTLVGILDADMMLNRPDFRAFERSFQMMSQVAGRAGRKNKRGKVIIQTGDVDHWVMELIHQHDYKGFYKAEILERKNFFYPPFYKLINFTFKHKDPQLLDNSCALFANQLREIFGSRVIGPDYPPVRKIQNNYLKQIRLKYEKDASDKQVKDSILQVMDTFYQNAGFKSIRINVDVDPT